MQYTEVTKAYMRSILVLLGADDDDDLNTAIDSIFEFERSLSEVTTRRQLSSYIAQKHSAKIL